MKKKPAKKKPITQRNACDRMFSQIIRARGRCQSCGTTENLQCSHVMRRTYAWTRTKELNALCLCAGCHWRWHQDPAFPGQLIERTLGWDTYNEIHHLALVGVGHKFDWTAERERLKAIYAEVFA